jgi:hypothetical protein
MPGLLFDFASLSAAKSLRKIQQGNEETARIRALSEVLQTTTDPALRTQIEALVQIEVNRLQPRGWWQAEDTSLAIWLSVGAVLLVVLVWMCILAKTIVY